MKISFEEGVPDKKEKGVFAIEMKDGEVWKVARVPLRVGSSDIDFENELGINSGLEREEEGMIFVAFEGPLNLQDIQSFVLVPED